MNRRDAYEDEAIQIERVYDRLDALAPPPAELLSLLRHPTRLEPFERPATGPDDAPRRWGLVKALFEWSRACAASSPMQLRASVVEAPGPDWAGFWAHGVAVGLSAIAGVSASRAGELFLCGLMHDVGKAALVRIMPKSYARVARLGIIASGNVRTAIHFLQGLAGAEHERRLLGLDHTQAGRRLAERWGLSRAARECIWLHHTPVEALPLACSPEGSVRIVQWANRAARTPGSGLDEHLVNEGDEVFSRFSDHSLTGEHLEGWLEAVREEVHAMETWLSGGEAPSPPGVFPAQRAEVNSVGDVRAELYASRRTAAHQAACLKAISEFAGSIRRGSSLREGCGEAARALKAWYGLKTIIVFSRREDRPWLEFASAGAIEERGVLDLASFGAGGASWPEGLEGQAGEPSWLSVEAAQFGPLASRFRLLLGEGTLWYLPLCHGGEHIGGALTCRANKPEATGEVELEQVGKQASGPLLAMISMALVQTRSESAISAMRDDLAEVNRRLLAMRDQVIRARAVDAVASLAAGAAHELNNPLAVISGRAQLLRGRAATPEDREALDQIVRQAHAASELVSSLLEFAEPPEARLLPIDLRAWLPKAIPALLEARSISSASCSVSISSDTPAVFGGPDLLTRALGELIDNAWAAMEGRPARLTIKAFGDCAEECAVVQVTDNGRGMTPDVQARAMDPFFSQGPAGRKQGLGLARVQRWIQAGAGSVRIRSVPEGGTTVELRLPSKRPANRG